MSSPYAIVRRQQAVLSAVAEGHVGALPARVTRAITAAADELLDPLLLPDLLPTADPAVRDAGLAVTAVVTALREVIPYVDAATALACGRAVRELVDAQADWLQ
jgi:hypothetical protein